MNIETLVQLIPNKNKVVIDVGASVGASPAFTLMNNPNYCSKGLCVEGAKANADKLKAKVQDKPYIDVHNGMITPDNVISLFEQYNIPLDPDVYKQDIDGYDLTLLRTIFAAGYRPKILYVEYNEKIPPSIKFEVKYEPEHFWDGSHFFGFSLRSGYEVFKANDYVILALPDGNNILAVHTSFMNIAQLPIDELYRKFYLQAPQFWWYGWNQDIRHWNNLAPEQAVDDIINYFTSDRKMRGQTDLGVPIKREAFVCEL